jgi:hypothetical protein
VCGLTVFFSWQLLLLQLQSALSQRA